MHTIATQFRSLEEELNEFFVERRDPVRAAILAILSGEHLFVLGTPGGAKTQYVTALVSRIMGARKFKVAMSKRRPAEVIFGPIDLKEYRENGNYWLKRKGYATDCEFCTFDEIGKMSDITGHDMLNLLNEREYDEVRDGLSSHPAPLSSAFTMSNEMLTNQSEDAAALWDRLLFRVIAGDIVDRSNFVRLLTGSAKPDLRTEIDWTELKDVIDNEVPNVKVTDDTLQALVTLRYDRFMPAGLSASPRRWKASIKALQASAFLEGRDHTTPADIAVLRFVLWDTVETQAKVERLTLQVSSPFAERLFDIRDVLGEVDTELGVREQYDIQDIRRSEYQRDATKKLEECRTQLDLMLIEAGGDPIPMFKVVSDFHRDTLHRLWTGICNMPRETLDTPEVASMLGSGDGGNR
jgi:MoxR-like ATPase